MLTVGENTYATEKTIQEFLVNRGFPTMIVTEAAVLRAMDYLESLPWVPDYDGVATEYLRWGTSPPAQVVKALCEAVRLEVSEPGSLAPTSDTKLKAVSAGPVSITFGAGEGKPSFPSITRHLRGLLVSTSFVERALI